MSSIPFVPLSWVSGYARCPRRWLSERLAKAAVDGGGAHRPHDLGASPCPAGGTGEEPPPGWRPLPVTRIAEPDSIPPLLGTLRVFFGATVLCGLDGGLAVFAGGASAGPLSPSARMRALVAGRLASQTLAAPLCAATLRTRSEDRDRGVYLRGCEGALRQPLRGDETDGDGLERALSEAFARASAAAAGLAAGAFEAKPEDAGACRSCPAAVLCGAAA